MLWNWESSLNDDYLVELGHIDHKPHKNLVLDKFFLISPVFARFGRKVNESKNSSGLYEIFKKPVSVLKLHKEGRF